MLEHCWILSWTRLCLIVHCLGGGGEREGVALMDCVVGQILSWAIPSRRSKFMSTGNSNSVDWDCGVGFGDLLVGFFCGPDSVCSLFLDLNYFFDYFVG